MWMWRRSLQNEIAYTRWESERHRHRDRNKMPTSEERPPCKITHSFSLSPLHIESNWREEEEDRQPPPHSNWIAHKAGGQAMILYETVPGIRTRYAFSNVLWEWGARFVDERRSPATIVCGGWAWWLTAGRSLEFIRASIVFLFPLASLVAWRLTLFRRLFESPQWNCFAGWLKGGRLWDGPRRFI